MARQPAPLIVLPTREQPGKCSPDNRAYAGPILRQEGKRATQIHGGKTDTRGQRPIDHAFPEPAREFGHNAATCHGTDQIVANSHGSGCNQMGHDRAGQSEIAPQPGMAAVNLGNLTDHAQIGGERHGNIGQCERDDGCCCSDLPGSGLADAPVVRRLRDPGEPWR